MFRKRPLDFTSSPEGGKLLLRELIIPALLCASTVFACAENEGEATEHGLNSLREVALSVLSQQDRNPLGAKALAIHPQEWRHAETEHFVYHYVHGYVATPISVEAEFNLRVILSELERDDLPAATPKSHIYIFEKPDDWKMFQANARLEPWTGGIHLLGSLFIVRDPAIKFSNNSLGHEIAHLIFFHLYQRELPRWLNEGFAEYSSRISKASYARARNYIAHARSRSIPADQFIPLQQLTTMDYPPAPQVGIFYAESERLVRYLVASDRGAFLALLDAVGRGEAFDTALARTYGSRFFDVTALETDFASYASQNARPISAP